MGKRERDRFSKSGAMGNMDELKETMESGWGYFWMWLIALLAIGALVGMGIGLWVNTGYVIEIEDDFDKLIKLAKAINASVAAIAAV